MHPIFDSGHLLDIVITDITSILVVDLTVELVSTISESNIISLKLKPCIRKEVTKKITFRKVSNLDYSEFNSVICDI